MAHSDLLSPHEALTQLLQPLSPACLDVRSESEWADGSVPGFANDPILTDAERHRVGTCYKEHGQDAAFALGYALTAPHKNERLARWQALAARSSTPMLVSCWRGGARSRIACEWLAEAGIDTWRVQDGYKAMRALLRETLLQPTGLLVLSGATGTGKTRLLRELAVPKVDLEGCANHRGSAFGGLGDQPAQQTFENRIALAFWSRQREYLIEDESRLIGVNQLPLELKDAMYAAPAVVLELSLTDRVQLTHDEYVLQPLQQGLSVETVAMQLQSSLDRIARKLGGERYQQLSMALAEAMRAPADVAQHQRWIAPLLADYYDPRYRHSFEQQTRRVVFRGDRDGCRAFLLARAVAIG